MKTACVLVILALAAVGSADRSLLAPARAPAPAPAPGPSANCPPKQSPASNCVVTATTFQAQCTSFITTLQQKTGGQVTATSDAQIQTLVSGLGATPSATCCTAATNLFKNACACDASVQAVAKSVQNLTPTQFQTVGKVFLVACNQPTCTDTCDLASS